MIFFPEVKGTALLRLKTRRHQEESNISMSTVMASEAELYQERSTFWN